MQEETQSYREDIRDLEFPDSILDLPLERNYPVPWFVAMVNDKYDFRVADQKKFIEAVGKKLCWVCGRELKKTFTFVIGPMCLINRINSEPPSHDECAEFSVKACPYLTQKQVKYNDSNMPEGIVDPAGVLVKRQPGATVLYKTDNYTVSPILNGYLINLARPFDIEWWTKGRKSTYEEALESLESGIPFLQKMVDDDKKTERRYARQIQLLFDRKCKIARKMLPGNSIKKPMLGSAAKRFKEI